MTATSAVPMSRAKAADTEKPPQSAPLLMRPGGPLAAAAAAAKASGPLVVMVRDDEEIWKQWEGLRLLGEGVYGRVYLVRNRETHETMAFKRMYLHSRKKESLSAQQQQLLQQHPDLEAAAAAAGGGSLPAVLQREVTVLRALRGLKNIINIQRVFIGSHRVYLAFPLVQGGTLSDCLRSFACWADHLRLPSSSSRSRSRSNSNTRRGTPSSSRGSFAAFLSRTEGTCLCLEKEAPNKAADKENTVPKQQQQQHEDYEEDDDDSCCVSVCCCCPCIRCIPPAGLPLGLCLRIAFSLLRGVALFHEKRIVHRDIKPDNILLGWTELPVHPKAALKTLQAHRRRLLYGDLQQQQQGESQAAAESDSDCESKDPGDNQEEAECPSEDEGSEDLVAPPPLISSLFIADFGLARTLPFFTRRECSNASRGAPGGPYQAPGAPAEASAGGPREAEETPQEPTSPNAPKDALINSPTASLRQAAAAAAAATRESCCRDTQSSALCLSPEIITLNYRPLEVLLGSNSYTLAVDIWSVG